MLMIHMPSTKKDKPLHPKLACFKQSRGLIFPSQSVLKIVKAAEVLFKNRVLFKDKQILIEKNLELKIQYGVLQQLGPDIFARSSGHFLITLLVRNYLLY